MMKDIVIIGAGGFGREVQWLIERINDSSRKDNRWNILGYIDDNVEAGTDINGYRVLGGMEYLLSTSTPLAVTCAIGASKIREKAISKIRAQQNLYFPNLIDPSVLKSDLIEIGEGNIICAGTIMTVNIRIADFCIVNLDCTIGHDDVLDSFVTIYPSVNVSGCVHVGMCSELGTGTQIIQGKNIGSGTIIGAGAVVVKNMPDECTAVGSPCKPIKFHNMDISLQNSGGGYNVNDEKNTLLILGASGHGKVAADIAAFSYKKVLFIDDDKNAVGTKGVPVVGDSSYAVIHKNDCDVFVAVGNSKIREKLNTYYKENGVTLVSLVHPNACVSANTDIGTGTIIMAGAAVNTDCHIGNGVIVNTGATIDHDNMIDDYAHISVGAHVAGSCVVGKCTWIGAGATVSNNVNICSSCMIGAGAVVIKDIKEPGTYVGVPVEKIK